MISKDFKTNMYTLESDLIVYVDVDDTLISWQSIGFDLEFFRPGTVTKDNGPQNATNAMDITFNGVTRKYWVFGENIESLKAHVHKGHQIVVWSGSGWRWARAVVDSLGLQEYVSLVTSKPKWLLDDMKPQDCMPTPYWGPGDPGKTKLK